MVNKDYYREVISTGLTVFHLHQIYRIFKKSEF